MMSSTRPGLSGGAGVEGTDQGQAPAAKSTYSMQVQCTLLECITIDREIFVLEVFS